MKDDPCRCGCGRTVGTWQGGDRCGYARSCYNRWLENGRPASGPPPPRRAPGGKGIRAGRLEDYQELLSWGLTPQEAQLRMGVCRTTIRRYEKALAEIHECVRSAAA